MYLSCGFGFSFGKIALCLGHLCRHPCFHALRTRDYPLRYACTVQDVQGSSAKLEMEVADDPESTSALPQDICTVLNAAQSSLSGVVDAEPGELLNNSLDNMQASVLDSTESSNADGQEEKLALPFLGEHGTESPSMLQFELCVLNRTKSLLFIYRDQHADCRNIGILKIRLVRCCVLSSVETND